MTNSIADFVNHPVTMTLYDRGYTTDLMKKYGAGNTPYLSELYSMVEYVCKVKMRNNVDYTEKFIIDCADRYIAGKRKTSMPYHATNKRKGKEREKNLKDQGGMISIYIEEAILNNEKAVANYKSGNVKALGALVGYILKKEKLDPAVVSSLLTTRLNAA